MNVKDPPFEGDAGFFGYHGENELFDSAAHEPFYEWRRVSSPPKKMTNNDEPWTC